VLQPEKMANKIYQPHLSTANDARAIRTREALRRALLDLLEVKPLEQITIRDIAAAAGIGYTTFFRHHPTKESLLDDLAAEQIRRLINLALPVMDARNARAASEALFAYVDEQRSLWSTLLTGGAAGALREEFLRITREIAVTWPGTGTWPPVEVATLLVVSGTLELLAWWLRQSKPLPIEEIADIHHQLVVQPTISSSRKGARRAAPRHK
jgi:AcrR family transcriptional regulator